MNNGSRYRLNFNVNDFADLPYSFNHIYIILYRPRYAIDTDAWTFTFFVMIGFNYNGDFEV